jgi:tRNA (guanine-N7-)-methyltransferase
MTTILSSQRLFGRRKGRPLRTNKARLIEELLPRLQIVLGDFSSPFDLFPSSTQKLWLEIGFGGGEHLAKQAQKNPEIGFIGCDPFVNGIASLLDHIDKNKISNIRLFPNDARLLLDSLPNSIIDRCFVLFPDPWPKARHAKRRFIGSENLPHLARVLRQGAELRLATDDENLAGWMREALRTAKEFRVVEDSFDPPDDWASTRYEQKAIKAGRKPVHLTVVRNNSDR